jgi:hypothetical protein
VCRVGSYYHRPQLYGELDEVLHTSMTGEVDRLQRCEHLTVHTV